MPLREYCLAIAIIAVLLTTVNCQCRDIPSDDQEQVRRCFLLYDTLESALLTPENLYILRGAFFPTSRRSPTILDNLYSIEPSIELDDGNTIANNYSIGWTGSALFSIIDPITLAAFQSGWFYALDIAILPCQVSIELDVRNHTLPPNITSNELRTALEELTTRVSKSALLLAWEE